MGDIVRITRYPCLVAVALLLASCGGPSDDDVKSAIKAKVQAAAEQQKAMAKFIGGNELAQMMPATDMSKLSIEVGKKTELPDGSYSAVVTLKGPGGTDTSTVKLAKAKDGWTIVE